MNDGLEIWVVYRRPRDLPGVEYAARKQTVLLGTVKVDCQVLVASSLEGIRRQLPPDLFRMPPYPGDDPCIVECWL